MGYKQKHPYLMQLWYIIKYLFKGGGIDAKMESHRKPPKL